MSPENSTPEWFQLAQADGYEPKPQKKRVLRIAALSAPLFVLGAGLVFAQTQDSPTAIASGVAASAPASPAASSSPISLATAAAETAPTTATSSTSSAIQVSQNSSTTPSAQPSITIKKPAITMPTGGGEDDGLSISDDGGVRSSDDD